MFAFPSMLVPSATQAGIVCPPNPDEYDMRDYPHFAVFCLIQLGRPLRHPTLTIMSNAAIIAAIPDDQIMTVTPQDLLDRGFDIDFAAP